MLVVAHPVKHVVHRFESVEQELPLVQHDAFGPLSQDDVAESRRVTASPS